MASNRRKGADWMGGGHAGWGASGSLECAGFDRGRSGHHRLDTPEILMLPMSEISSPLRRIRKITTSSGVSLLPSASRTACIEARDQSFTSHTGIVESAGPDATRLKWRLLHKAGLLV